MSSNKRAEIKPNSKLGRIIFNDQPRGPHARSVPTACEYVYGDPTADPTHYCGKPLHRRRYCEEHYHMCYTVKTKRRLVAV